MADDQQTPTPSTSTTSTTNATTTSPADGSGQTTLGSTSDGGLASALGDGTGKTTSAGDQPGGDASKPTDKPSTAPEKYEAWTTPEGYELDAGLVEEATPIFKELGLTQEQSQKLVDFYSKHSIASSKEAEQAITAWAEQRKEWRNSLLTDPVLGKLVGKDGKHGIDSPLAVTINRALDGLQNPALVSDFKAAMELTGAGDNPAFVKVFHALASMVTEGATHVAGGPVAAAQKRPATAAAAIYPNLPSQHGS